MKHLSLFSGIGGFDLAAEWMGWENVAHCEWNPFCQKILKYYWPNAISYDDITKTDFTIHRGTIDVLTGGFPCQPYSVAGKRKGKEDERHLWPEMLRAIREIQPTWVVGENVRGLIGWNGGLVFDEVQTDLENEGYEVQPFLLPACAVDAPHRRDRIWFVAYKNPDRSDDGRKKTARNKTINGNVSTASEMDTTFIANPNNNGLHGSENGQGNRKGNDYNETGANTIIEFEGCGSEAVVANPEDKRYLQRAHGSKKWNTSRYTERESTRICSTFTNTHSGRQSSEKHGEKKSRQFAKESIPTHWKDFPTQSPICDGNDGFSTESLRQRLREDSLGYLSEKEIDKILSKASVEWRNESIKGGGML